MGQDARGGRESRSKLGARSSPADVVVSIGEVTIPNFNMEHHTIVIVHVESEALKESRVESLRLNGALKLLRA